MNSTAAAAALEFEALCQPECATHSLLSGQNQDPGLVRRAHAGVGLLPPHRAALHREFERGQAAPAGPGRPDRGGEANSAGLPPGLPPGGRAHWEAHAVRCHLPLPGRGAHHRRQPGLQVAIRERSRPGPYSFSGGSIEDNMPFKTRCVSSCVLQVSPWDKREEANEKKQAFALANSDHLALLQAYKVCFGVERCAVGVHVVCSLGRFGCIESRLIFCCLFVEPAGLPTGQFASLFLDHSNGTVSIS